MGTGPIVEQVTKADPFTGQKKPSGRVCMHTSMAPLVPGVILSPEPRTGLGIGNEKVAYKKPGGSWQNILVIQEAGI